MKTFYRNFTTGLFFSACLLLAAGCSQKMQFAPSSIVPAAQGDIKVKKDKNDNYQIELSVKNLAKPERLQPSRTTYVVWAVSPDNRADNLGQIKADGGDTTVDGSLETMTTFQPERVFITAEDQGSVQYPSAQVVLSTEDNLNTRR